MNRAPASQARKRVIERIAEITVIEGVQIEDGTEIYHELRISGWDLWEFLDWVSAEFGTDFSRMNTSKYSPSEGAELFAGTYRSLAVGAVLDAISQGVWIEAS